MLRVESSPPRRNARRRIAVALPAILIALPALALLAGCGPHDAAAPESRGGSEVEARVIEVSQREIPEPYVTTGTLVSDERVQIASRVMGFIRGLSVREGQSVTAGQRLLTIDPTTIEAAVREAEARVAQAKARYDEAEADFERHRALRERQLISESLYRKVELQFQVARQDLNAARATLERARSELQYAEIKSPVTGVVVQRHKENGDIANPGEAILTLEDPTRIILRTFVKEQHLDHIQIRDPVTVRIDTQRRVIQGSVSQIVPAGDPATHSYLVKVELDDTSGVRSGMFARAEFVLGHRLALTVPAAAQVNRADIDGVYVVDSENVVHLRMVRTGRRLGEHIEILSGLQAGERIAIPISQPLNTGDHVNPPAGGTDSSEANAEAEQAQ